MSGLPARMSTLRERARALLDVVEEFDRASEERQRVQGAPWSQEVKDKRDLIVGMATNVLQPEFDAGIHMAADPDASLADWEDWISMRVHDAMELTRELRRLRSSSTRPGNA